MLYIRGLYIKDFEKSNKLFLDLGASDNIPVLSQAYRAIIFM